MKQKNQKKSLSIDNIPSDKNGKTTISPEVLITIARLTTLEVNGVSRMSNLPAGFNRLFNRKYGEGVRLSIKDDVVSADLFIILENGVNIREVSRNIQYEITRAITDMVGMEVGNVNIHIEDIDFLSEQDIPADGHDAS